jgi:RNA polymerase sigma factor (sigma-70 family)
MSQKNKKGWSDFFTQERGKLIGYIRSQLADAAERDSEDILQDVITGIFDRADIVAPIENFAAYTYQAIRNRVIDLLRKKKSKTSIDAAVSDDTDIVFKDTIVDGSADVAMLSEQKEIAKDIENAVSTLDELDREIFIATEFQDLSFQELSEYYEIPIGTLLSRKSRAMKKLQKELISMDPMHYSDLFKKG